MNVNIYEAQQIAKTYADERRQEACREQLIRKEAQQTRKARG